MSTCATNVTYNSITIRNVLTESVDMTTVYDSTNVDPVGIYHTVTFTGELHTSELDEELHGHRVAWSGVGIGLAPGLHDMVRNFLRPRQEFQMKINDELLFDIFPDAAAACGEASGRRLDGGDTPLGTIKKYDIANGPRTKCQVLAIKGAYSAKCRFTVEFTTPMQCGDDGTVIKDILNVRWTVADDIDCKAWLTRRMYQGRIRFRSRSTAINPHGLARVYAFPPLLHGFRRENISYHEDPNALELTFQIVDQEVWANAPSPATHWEGTYTMSFPQYGVACEQELSLVLRCDQNQGVTKRHLVTLAMYIMEAKLHWEWLRTNAPGTIFLQSSMLQENLAENEIRFSARTISHKADAWVANLRAFGTGTFEFGQPLPTSVSKWTRDGILNPRDKYYDRGRQTTPTELSAAGSSLLAALQNPCCTKDLAQDPVFVEAAQIAVRDPEPKSDTTTVSPYTTARYSESHNKAAYQFYRMSSTLDTNTGWLAFPLGKQCTTSSSAATVAFAHLHCPVQVRKVTIHATRINAWPELIKPVHWKDPNTNITHVLARYTIDPSPVQLSADGRDAMHEVAATYWYYLDRPYEADSHDKIPVGRLPYVTKTSLNLGVYGGDPGDHPDPDGSAIDQQFMVNPADLLAAVTGNT